MLAIRTHPLGAIYIVKSTDAFTRGERILVQTTTFCMLLLCSVALFYSRALNCCAEVEASWAARPGAGGGMACLGAPTCVTMARQRTLRVLPAELQDATFVCHAFPEATWLGRGQTVVVMTLVLLPVHVLFSALFSFSTSSGVLRHWHPAPHKQPDCNRFHQQTMRWLMPVMQAFAFAVYSMFFNLEKFAKAFAMMLILLIRLCGDPISRMLSLLHFIGGAVVVVRLQLARASEYFKVHVLGRPPTSVSEREESIRRQLSSTIEGWVNGAALSLLLLLWAVTVWVLLTYGMLIRQLMGAGVEAEVLQAFGIGVLVEQVGLESAKQISIRVFVAHAVSKLQSMFNKHHPVELWYESAVQRKIERQPGGSRVHDVDDDDGDEATEFEADGGGDIVI
ncbi:hypothetical protein CYMTET_42833 [Cymbomonas tetramitiformis]|uniref:Uncharacterized protein n=1 Tax=Cymbomonas tetramitiformis TaxID=36881 RepID=A0AAE0C5H1_9CHLO|nr:hypothetical protein CYMTET_42833 [Cymbomonas tetramitiformis]